MGSIIQFHNSGTIQFHHSDTIQAHRVFHSVYKLAPLPIGNAGELLNQFLTNRLRKCNCAKSLQTPNVSGIVQASLGHRLGIVETWGKHRQDIA